MATHSSFLAWRIPWTEEPCRLVHGVAKESDMTLQLNNKQQQLYFEGILHTMNLHTGLGK